MPLSNFAGCNRLFQDLIISYISFNTSSLSTAAKLTSRLNYYMPELSTNPSFAAINLSIYNNSHANSVLDSYHQEIFNDLLRDTGK